VVDTIYHATHHQEGREICGNKYTPSVYTFKGREKEWRIKGSLTKHMVTNIYSEQYCTYLVEQNSLPVPMKSNDVTFGPFACMVSVALN